MLYYICQTLYERRYKTVPVCCDGYKRNEEDICVPACKGGCLNGWCLRPNVCDCAQDDVLNSLGHCVPCNCEHGTCLGTDNSFTTSKLQINHFTILRYMIEITNFISHYRGRDSDDTSSSFPCIGDIAHLFINPIYYVYNQKFIVYRFFSIIFAIFRF